MKEILNVGRKDFGLWSPACVNHVYLPSPFFSEKIAKIGQAVTLAQAVEEFLADPLHGERYLVEDPWLANLGCSGVEFTSIVQQQRLFSNFYRWRRYALGKI